MRIEDEKLLQKLKQTIKYGKSQQERRRAHALVLSHEGYTKQNIAQILNVTSRSIFLWIKEFKGVGMESLKPQSGRGRKTKLSVEKDKEIIQKHIEAYPNKPKQAYALTLQEIDIDISYDTFKRFLKKHCI